MNRVMMPFNFKRSRDAFLLANLAGDHVFLAARDFEHLVSGKYQQLSQESLIVLESRHFLLPETEQSLAEEMLSIKLRSRKNFLKSFTSLHMVVLTLRCNCHCDYCHASSKDTQTNGFDMDISTATAVLQQIFSSPSSDIKIEFQGGEPMLNWPVLRHIVLEGEKMNSNNPNRRLSFVVCTNLMDITDDQLNFIKEHNICISTSCDGPKYFHDIHRKARDGSSSYDIFIANLQRVKQFLGGEGVSALLTVTKDNLAHLQEVIDHYEELGFRNIFIRALNPYGYAAKNEDSLGYLADDFLDCYRNALLYILDMNRQGKFFIESYAALLLQRILTPFATGFVDLQSPSGAGISGAIYHHNGDVYPADEARMLATTGDCVFKLGNVHTENYLDMFHGKTLQDLVWNSCIESLPECNSCVYSPYCGADPIRYYVESKDIVGKRPQSEFCKKNMGMFDILFELIHENNPETMAIFWSWVHRRPMEEWMTCGR